MFFANAATVLANYNSGVSGIANSRERTSSSDSDVSDSWKAAAETAGVDQPSSVDNTEMEQLARPCSTLSLAELGELCGDAERDDCGDSFLVGGDCDDPDGAGIRLDLLDLALEVRSSERARGCSFEVGPFVVVLT